MIRNFFSLKWTLLVAVSNRKKSLRIFPFLLFLFLISCSSYVKKWHDRIDEIEKHNSEQRRLRSQTPFEYLNNNSGQGERRVGAYSTTTTKNLKPRIQRNYKQGKRRNTVRNLYDNSREGSLWSGMGQENYLFTRNNIKKYGDIVIINVEDNLKRKISLELAQEYPGIASTKKIKKQGEENRLRSPSSENVNKVYDRVSGVIIDEINRDHLLVRGRKEVFYKRKKRLVEIHALVARRDIGNSDMINSSKILELRIAVLK